MSKTIILLITFATIIIAVGVYLYTVQTKQAGIACTMEAKLCPDGSYVGRTGPDCEFTICPNSTPAVPSETP